MKRFKQNEEGTVTAFVVTFTVTLLFVAGLVIDGGFILAARRQAITEAEAAARAGAQAITAIGPGGSDVALDPVRATELVNSYLISTGHSGITTVDGGTVSVEVSFSRPMTILGIGGLWSVDIHGRGSANAVTGVMQQGDL